ncbi:MAG: hypothetical protein HC927_08530 [Deltaproteobacteria bacterium]|nr:hypothetical protein [Deltaproteobacteria bacterium]
MTITRAVFSLTLCLLPACDPGIEEPRPEPIGLRLYERQPDRSPVQDTLHSDLSYTTVQLVSSDGEREVIASFVPATADFLEAELEAVADGASLGEFDPYCLSWVDKDTSILYVPSRAGLLAFTYPWLCPPSGLAELDEVLRDVVIAMRDCSPSAHITDCEIVR